MLHFMVELYSIQSKCCLNSIFRTWISCSQSWSHSIWKLIRPLDFDSLCNHPHLSLIVKCHIAQLLFNVSSLCTMKSLPHYISNFIMTPSVLSLSVYVSVLHAGESVSRRSELRWVLCLLLSLCSISLSLMFLADPCFNSFLFCFLCFWLRMWLIFCIFLRIIVAPFIFSKVHWAKPLSFMIEECDRRRVFCVNTYLLAYILFRSTCWSLININWVIKSLFPSKITAHIIYFVKHLQCGVIESS